MKVKSPNLITLNWKLNLFHDNSNQVIMLSIESVANSQYKIILNLLYDQ